MRSEIKLGELAPNTKFVNFFELSDEQFENFKRQVALHKGILEVYIHPFFHSNQTGNVEQGRKYTKEKAIETEIGHRLSGQAVKPSLIFEEDGYHQELERHIQNPETPVIFVITEPNRTKPKGSAKSEGRPTARLILRLKEAGVGEIQLAGAVLIKKWKDGKPVLEGCVGEAAQIFGKDFKISFLENLAVIDERPKPQFRYGNE